MYYHDNLKEYRILAHLFCLEISMPLDVLINSKCWLNICFNLLHEAILLSIEVRNDFLIVEKPLEIVVETSTLGVFIFDLSDSWLFEGTQ